MWSTEHRDPAGVTPRCSSVAGGAAAPGCSSQLQGLRSLPHSCSLWHCSVSLPTPAQWEPGAAASWLSFFSGFTNPLADTPVSKSSFKFMQELECLKTLQVLKGRSRCNCGIQISAKSCSSLASSFGIQNGIFTCPGRSSSTDFYTPND